VAHIGSWTLDIKRGVLVFSEESYRIFNMAPGTVLSYDVFLERVHPDDRKYVDRSWRAAIRHNRPLNVVHRILIDHETRWVRERAELTFDAAGLAVGAIGTIQDISEPERARISLAESEHFLRATLSALPDSIVVLDDQGRILKSNQAWREFPGLNGLTASSVDEGANYLDVCDRAAAEGVAEAAAAAALIRDLIGARRIAGSFEYACNSSQEERWFLCRGTRFQTGEVVRVVIIYTNISTRKVAEEALRRLNEELEETVRARTAEVVRANREVVGKEQEIRSVLDNLSAGVISINEKGIIQSANRAVEGILGYSVAQVMGQNVSMLMGETDRAAHGGHIERYLRTGQARIIGMGREVEGLHKDGSRIPLDASVSEYFIEGERFFTGFLRDNRERAAILKELTQAREQAELASRAKSEFLAAMSHEIRTPMNGVIGMIDVLQLSSLQGEQLEMVDLIRESAYSLLGIIDDILDYSKIEAGRLDIDRTAMSVEDVVEGVCLMLDRMAVKIGVELDLFIDPGIPPNVLGDAGRLRQVLVNLLGNAIKFSGGQENRARVWVRAVLADCSPDQVVVEFEVADTGIGMDAVTVSRLFTPFTQADASTTRRFGGTGLGLAISRQLVELMGGQISAHSAAGEGSTFTVRLPFTLLREESEAGADTSLVAGLSCVAVGNTDGLAGSLAAYLTQAGATVHRALNLIDARQHVDNYPPGLSVWVVDTGDERPSAEELLAAVRVRPDVDPHFVVVVVERGQRRTPRRIASEVIMVDGNVLRRKTFLTAVAAAAGRAPLEAALGDARHDAARLVPPSREEALQQGRLILVAEDNSTNQKVILLQLNLLGFSADVVGNGRDALQRWRSCPYALLLTDLHMPEMDGYELARAIRAAEASTRHVPIIALTANALIGEADRCRAAGMDDYLSKPTPVSELKAMLERWLPAVRSLTDSTEAIAGAPVSLPQAKALPVDLSALKELVGDDPAVLREVLQDFRASAVRIISDLRTACAAGQTKAAGGAAHKLKSSARAIGAFALSELCADMERAGDAGDSAALAERVPLFNAEMAIVDAYLDSL
jgi:PAS domain S-box-containing protein